MKWFSSSKVGQMPSCKFYSTVKTIYKCMQKVLKNLFLRLNFSGTPHFYQQLSLVFSEAYSSSNCQQKRFLNHVLTAKILHLHK